MSEKDDIIKLIETAAAILAKNLCFDTNAETATMDLESLSFKGQILGDYEIIVTRKVKK